MQYGSILSCSQCPTSSIMATVSDDKTVKIWNFQPEKGNFAIKYNFNMHENPLVVDIHPLSLQMAIGSRES